MREDPSVGLVAPRLVDEDGSLDFSQRRFPRLRSTYAQALFLHRIFAHAQWTDEVIRDPRAYERAGPVEWVSGACVLVRRSALERLGGWDQGFFHYGEDIDICSRLWRSGFELRFEPGAARCTWAESRRRGRSSFPSWSRVGSATRTSIGAAAPRSSELASPSAS